ncbi:MAG: hypothetical protein FWG30_03720 [Eubacteriaceae bacterium]|jgi:hypothetical protein|nr:hypothetical protein [Eubacteriaceae bacterium]
MVITLALLTSPSAPSIFNDVISLMSKVVSAGGTLWLIWGLIVLATGIKDKSGPQLQSGIWQIIGGGLIIMASELFKNVSL